MADIPSRDRKESRIAALIKRAYGRTREQLIAALGDPPDVRNIPDSLWDQLEKQIEDDLRDAIAIVLLLQMRAIDLDLSLADDSGQRLRVNPQRAGQAAARYAARRARRVASSTIGTFRDRLETASRDAREQIESARRTAEQAESEAAEARDLIPDEQKRIQIERKRSERDGRKELRRRIKEIEREQAGSVGATETTNAGTAGEQQYRKQVQREFGVLIVPTWRTARDARVCPVCGPLDGTAEAEWGEEFRDGPPAHPNCRCTLRWEESFVLEGA